MHGMGDAADNAGMVSMRKAISQRLGGAYVLNVALGASAAADSRNSIFLNMDLQVEAFAMQVRKDYRLAHGFNAIGYSQGNLVIRGYVERYNQPPVHSFVSMHGPLAGVGGFPNCNLSVALCRTIERSLGSLAYTASIQVRLAPPPPPHACIYIRAPSRLRGSRASIGTT
jgi:palmitoyl-protein thioesterase